MILKTVVEEKLSPLRKIGFAAGDFGLNLYWQSISFFLVFFYTDVAGLSAGTAGLIYMAATIFEACLDPVVGALMDLIRGRWGYYRTWVIVGSVPLGASFSLLYWKPAVATSALIGILALTHLLFRLCYTLVAVPFSALTARMTDISIERTTLAGLRMLFATAAGSAVAFCTQPLVSRLGRADSEQGFFRTAICIALAATAIFLVTFISVREPARATPQVATPLRKYFRGVMGNHAFIALTVGLLFASATSATLGRSVIYYFKYVVGDESAARIALLLSSGAAFVTIPIWVAFARQLGKRIMWLVAAAIGGLGLTVFVAMHPVTTLGATFFFAWMQASSIGIAVAYWSMLPDTVEYGLWRTGIRQESFLFGLFSLFQKCGLGLAAGVFGLAFDTIGYVANVVQSQKTTNSIGIVIATLCAVGLIGSAIAIYLSPLRRGIHEKLVDELREQLSDSPR